MIEFLLGSAAIVSPTGQAPLLAAYCGTKAIKVLSRRRKRRSENTNLESSAASGVTLAWTNLSLTLQQKDHQPREILKNVSGIARPGRLLAVMGASGAGKTSLLNALARQVPYSSDLTFSGKIEINDISVSKDDAIRQAYVQQEDLFYSQLTLRETLDMACALRLPADLRKEERDKLVTALIAKLGLTNCADTIIGDAKTRGLSGGEKKRLSIGCELLNSPSLMFLDEPTTGLDAFQAEKVIEALKRLADEGHTIICTIHQPRSSVYAMFDDLILLAEGNVVYSGTAEKALDYFGSLGFKCPEHYNPAEYFIDMMSVDTSSPKATKESTARVQKLVDGWKSVRREDFEARESLGKNISSSGFALRMSGKESNWFRDFRLLLGRSWKQARRDKKTTMARLGMNVGSALIFGGIYYKMKFVASSIQDRVGLLQLGAVNTAMSSLVKTLNIFPSEQTIVTRERAKKAYGVLPYLCAKILSEIPVGIALSCAFGTLLYSMTGLNPARDRASVFIGVVLVESFASAALGLAVGGAAPSTEVAVAVGPMIMLLFIVFGGQFKNTEHTAKFLQWVPKASLIQNGFEAMCINEFSGVQFDKDPSGESTVMKSGDDVLSWLGFKDVPVKRATMRNARVLLFYYWMTYNILKAKKPKFTPLEPPQKA